MARTALFALALLLGAPAAAQAQGLDVRIDSVKAEVKVDRKRVRDAKRDYKKIGKIRKKWEKARTKGKSGLEARMDDKLSEWLREEIAEDREEMRSARGEVVEGGGDPRPDAKKGKPSSDGRPPKTDDERDLGAERHDLHKTRRIARELREMQRRFDRGNAGPKKYRQKSKLLGELHRAAERDWKRAERELAEDKRQLDRLKARR